MGAFDDPRGRLIIGHGRAFLEQDQNLYDVIIVDLVDMIEDTQISRLYTVEFYQLVRQRLRPGGIVAVQGLEFSFLDDEAHAAVARTLRAVFTDPRIEPTSRLSLPVGVSCGRPIGRGQTNGAPRRSMQRSLIDLETGSIM